MRQWEFEPGSFWGHLIQCGWYFLILGTMLFAEDTKIKMRLFLLPIKKVMIISYFRPSLWVIWLPGRELMERRNCKAFSRRASRMGYQTVYFILSPFVGLAIWPVYWEPYLVLFPVSPFANKPNVSFAEWINHALRLSERFAGNKF